MTRLLDLYSEHSNDHEVAEVTKIDTDQLGDKATVFVTSLRCTCEAELKRAWHRSEVMSMQDPNVRQWVADTLEYHRWSTFLERKVTAVPGLPVNKVVFD